MDRARGIVGTVVRVVPFAALVATTFLVPVLPCLRGAGGVAEGVARAAGAVDAPTVQSLASMREGGFKWGINHKDVVNAFTKLGGIIDQDYDSALRHAQPGVQQQSIEADRDNKKSAIERSYIRFDTPTGYDSSAIKDEFSYHNNESLLLVERQGKKRYFFFMGAEPNERLWKIYDEIPLGGAMGKTFVEAVNKVQATVGMAGRARGANAGAGLASTTVDWQDGTTHLRVVDLTNSSDGANVGVVIEERATLNALPQLRSNKVDDPMAMDPSIAAATRGGISDPSNQAAPQASASAKPKKR